jgi:flagellar biosynthesis component FlhA
MGEKSVLQDWRVIFGIVVGSVLFLLIIILASFFGLKKVQNNRQTEKDSEKVRAELQLKSAGKLELKDFEDKPKEKEKKEGKEEKETKEIGKKEKKEGDEESIEEIERLSDYAERQREQELLGVFSPRIRSRLLVVDREDGTQIFVNIEPSTPKTPSPTPTNPRRTLKPFFN